MGVMPLLHTLMWRYLPLRAHTYCESNIYRWQIHNIYRWQIHMHLRYYNFGSLIFLLLKNQSIHPSAPTPASLFKFKKWKLALCCGPFARWTSKAHEAPNEKHARVACQGSVTELACGWYSICPQCAYRLLFWCTKCGRLLWPPIVTTEYDHIMWPSNMTTDYDYLMWPRDMTTWCY